MSTEPNAKSASFVLSEEDVANLLENSNPNVIITIADKIAGAYTNQALKVTDAMATEQIFRLLMKEAELQVRVTLADHLKSSTHLPKDIVMAMANDVQEVALPILQHSEVLSESDLLDLVNSTQEISRYLAVSKREHISGSVSDSLLSKGNDQVAATLVNNSGAEISDKGLEKIVQNYSKNQALMQAVSNRPKLPMAVTEKLIHVVSASLAATLKQKYKIPSKDIESEVEKNREKETLKLVGTTYSQEEVTRLVNQLHSFNRLTPSIILSALCQGNFCFFETSLAKLSNIPVSNARTLINDRGSLGFRAIYNKSGLPETLFPAVRLLLQAVRQLDEENLKPGSANYSNKVVERLLKLSEVDAPENLSYVIALVRRSP